MNLESDFLKYVAQTSPFSMKFPIIGASDIYLYTEDARYIDLTSGIAVANLGYSHPAVVEAIVEQARHYCHSNVYGEHVQAPQVELAERILQYFPNDHQIFFTNSGTEANELALKMARKFTGRSEHGALIGGFHGRTFGSMSISWNEKYRQGFGPLLPVQFFPRNDSDALQDLYSEEFASITIELVQGEAGAYPLDQEFVQTLGQVCEETETYLIFDEVQTGFGRTGTMFAQSQYGVRPDITVLGKAMGGGLPLGGVVASKSDFETLEDPPFSHVSTFGGNPVSCAAGLASLNEIEETALLSEVQELSVVFTRLLDELQGKFPYLIHSHRGLGFLRGLSFEHEEQAHQFVDECFKLGIIVGYKLNNPTTVRLAPPLIISRDSLEFAFAMMSSALSTVILKGR